MYVSQLITALALSFSIAACAQDVVFSFTPSGEYQGVLEMDMYTEHIVYVYHDSADSLDITWRVIENSCPEVWDIQMCDWQNCYDGFPNTAEMNPVPPGGSGYLKLLVNPYTTAGTGIIHFWVYPTGAIENREDVYFYLNTTATNLTDGNSIPETLTVRSGEIQLTNSSNGLCSILDLQGRVVLTEPCISDIHEIGTTFLPAGMYVLVSPLGNRYTFLKP